MHRALVNAKRTGARGPSSVSSYLLPGLENRDRAFVSEGHHVTLIRDHGMTALTLFVVPLRFAFVMRDRFFAAECCEAVCGECCSMKITLAHLMFLLAVVVGIEERDCGDSFSAVMGTCWGASVEEAPEWVPMPAQNNLAGSFEKLPPVRRGVLRSEEIRVSSPSAAVTEIWIAPIVRRRIVPRVTRCVAQGIRVSCRPRGVAELVEMIDGVGVCVVGCEDGDWGVLCDLR